MQRYFADNVNQDTILLNDNDIFHVTKVMRNVIGDELIAIYERKVYLGEIVSLKPFVVKNKGIKIENSRELDKEVTLMFSLAKGDKIDFAIQKATELGATNIVLIRTERCVVKLDNDDFNRKHDRYSKIAKEAAEQSERLIIPNVLGIYDINNIRSSLIKDVNLVAYEGSAFNKIDLSMIKNAKSINILIGPEGGIAEKEISSLEKQGFIKVSLGKRILRTETAAVAALSMINMVIEA